jgi:hypothetical protein
LPIVPDSVETSGKCLKSVSELASAEPTRGQSTLREDRLKNRLTAKLRRWLPWEKTQTGPRNWGKLSAQRLPRKKMMQKDGIRRRWLLY